MTWWQALLVTVLTAGVVTGDVLRARLQWLQWQDEGARLDADRRERDRRFRRDS